MWFQLFRFYFSFVFAIRDLHSAFGGSSDFRNRNFVDVFGFGLGLFVDGSLRRICGGFWVVVDFVDCFVLGARWQPA
ncbi:hypothetical protein GLYMA_20G046650v4 [Glycine max]|nr:hypothetical protein GLYMA_20G046650v4 [Glycine max]KAH1034524.1 hypothetical protein GYH30_054799 [Glycine max]